MDGQDQYKKDGIVNTFPIEEDEEAGFRAVIENALARPAWEAQDILISHPRAYDIVRSIAPQDIHLLVKETGPEDSLPLLSLASDAQWRHLLDMETWRGDRFDSLAHARWGEYLFEADPARAVRWLAKEELFTTELWLQKTIEVAALTEHDDPALLPEGFFSADGVFYVRVLDRPRDTAPEWEAQAAEAGSFAEKFLQKLAELDYSYFQKMLLELGGVIPAELEEEEYRLRCVRLAEQGHAPVHEAVAVYQPLLPKDLPRLPRTFRKSLDRSAPFLPVSLLSGENLFTRALAQVQDSAALEQIQSEFAGLANQVLTADRTPVEGRETLARAVAKCAGYAGLGMERLTGIPETSGMAPLDMVLRFPANTLFRLGYSLALELKWRASRWMKTAWFAKSGLGLGFWGEAWLGVLGGVLAPRPRYFDNYASSKEMYREFAAMEDIRKTSAVLDQIAAVDTLLGKMAFSGDEQRFPNLTWKNLLLTARARDAAGEGPGGTQDMETFRRFFQTLWEQGAPPRRVSLEAKSAFLAWVCRRSGLSGEDARPLLGAVFEALFSEIEAELGSVEPEHLDHRFLTLFSVGRKRAVKQGESPLDKPESGIKLDSLSS